MNYLSTRGTAPRLGFDGVLLAGLARDGGLYLPEALPRLDAAAIADLAGRPYAEVAERLIAPFTGDCFAPGALRAMTEAAYGTFRHPAVVPVSQLDANLYLLEIFHGPTLAFKDVAMQLLGHMMQEVLGRSGRRTTVVGATSGDTGAAAIEAFRGLPAVDVIILYPHGRVSDVQRRQMTGVDAPNIHAIAVEGTFDDCQAIVKALFNHHAFRDEMNLSGVNSINWARVLAQLVYFFTGAVALGSPHRKLSFAVPTGNFGDVLAGWIAKSMGLPVERLVVATNENDILARCLATGTYEVQGVRPTQSPSMDIQVSSNFERLLFEAYGRDDAAVRGLMAGLAQSGRFTVAPGPMERIRAEFDAVRVDEEGTQAEMARTFRDAGVVLDPHTAVGVAAAREALRRDPATPVVVLGTAHPAKFPDAVEHATGQRPPLPAHLADLLERPERFTVLPNAVEAIEGFIRERAGAEGAGATLTTRITTLPSGLRVITDAIPHMHTTSLGLWVGIGSRHETEAEHGLSHFLEHMAFKGTRTRSARRIAEEIEGAGGDLNAATSTEQTAYYARVLPGDAPLALDILSDILTDSAFDPAEIEREKEVVLQELGAVEDVPDDLVFELFTEQAYPDQPIGRPILGTPTGVKRFDRDAVKGFLERRYRADHTVIAAAGAVDHDTIVAEVERRFGKLQNLAGPAAPAARYRGGDIRLKRKLEQAHIVIGFEGLSFHDPRRYAAHVFSHAVGGGMSSRLFQEVREERGLAYTINSFDWTYADTGLFGFYAATGAANVAELVPVALDTLAEATETLTPDEIERAKAQLKVSLLVAMESSSARAEQIARQHMAYGRLVDAQEILREVDAVTVEGARAAGAAMIASAPTVSAIGPIGKVPGPDAVMARLGVRAAPATEPPGRAGRSGSRGGSRH